MRDNIMGLDNGIVLVTKHKIKQEDIPDYIDLSDYKEENNSYSYDICYWRKCYNIRGKILDIPHLKIDSSSGYYDISPKSIDEIITGLVELLTNPDDFFAETCIWEYNDMIPRIANDIVMLTWVKNYLKTDNTAYIYFYDSY